jgi:glycosyltransferase involved in cell wall biosynthesis
VRIAIVNYVWAADMASPDDVFARFPTLTGWSEAVSAAGGDVSVYQRFSTNARVDRNGVGYVFLADGEVPHPSPWTAGAEDLHDLVAAERPAVVHINGVLHPRRARQLRAVLPAGASLVVQDHGGFDPGAASPLTRAWIRRGLACADTLLVAAPDQAHEWRTSGVAPEGLGIVDVMESSTTLQPIARDRAQCESGVTGSPALLWVGRLTANKDPLTVLRGVAAFFETYADARLTMVYGAAELESQVRELVAGSSWLSTRVRLVGKVPHADLASYYSAADILVAGSHHEGSGYAVIEALACGAAPVVTDIAPFRALTDRGRVGALWTRGKPESLTRALMDVRVSDTQRRSCRQLFQERFSWPAIGRRAMAVYAQEPSTRPR